jgi:hypothetical protein
VTLIVAEWRLISDSSTLASDSKLASINEGTILSPYFRLLSRRVPDTPARPSFVVGKTLVLTGK